LAHAHQYGAGARGLFFRQTYPELEEVEQRFLEIFPAMGGKWLVGKHTWVFTNGARLRMRHLMNEQDAQSFQGQSNCVAIGTPILMADGTFMPIEEIQVGAYVQTLEGPRVVTATCAPYLTPCVSAYVYDVHGGFAGVQVHPWHHPVLTTVGLCGPRLAGLHGSVQQAHDVTSIPYRQGAVFPLEIDQDIPDWYAYARDEKTAYGAFGMPLPRTLRPRVLSVPVVLHARCHQLGSWVKTCVSGQSTQYHALCKSAIRWLDSYRPCQYQSLDQMQPDELSLSKLATSVPLFANDQAYALFGNHRRQDCRDDYPSVDDFCDERAPVSSGIVQGHTQQLSYAEQSCHLDILDEWDRLPRYSHRYQHTYRHPYTSEERCLSEDVVAGFVSLIPCGSSFVVDITVDQANHYITSTGLVNKNSWVGGDELGNYPTSRPIDLLRATLRSSTGVPCYFRGSANPGGTGHNWLRARYIDPAPPMTPFAATETVAGETITVKRCFIPSTLEDNALLMRNDPGYWQRVMAATGGNEALLKAWRYGLWDIVSGGMLDDVWDTAVHALEPFEVPQAWRIRRAFDWGSSRPFSCGWWAHADGETSTGLLGRVYPKGTRFRIMEYYGWNGKPNEGLRMTNTEIARQIKAMEDASPYKGRIDAGPADSQIFDVVNGTSIAQQMAACGIAWKPAQKGPGSRRQGWSVLRQLLKASLQWPMEEPGLFVFNTCRQFIRTVPILPRDKSDADDADSDAEDHCLHGATLVETPAGSYPIADLVGKTGFVLTDDGLKAFSNCRLTRKQAAIVLVRFSNGKRVLCTPDHLFLTLDRRWIQAQDLTDEICYNISSKKEDICTSQLLVQQSKNSMEHDIISADTTSSAKAKSFIKRYGNIIMGLYQKDVKSIINIMTVPAIKLRIWNCCLAGNIASTTPKGDSWGPLESNILRRPKLLRLRGMDRLKVNTGIQSTMIDIVAKLLPALQISRVPIVASPFKQGTEGKKEPFARMSVNQLTDAPVASTIKNAVVPSVIQHLRSIVTQNKRRVDMSVDGLSVVSVQPAGWADVYCLTVPDGQRFAIEGGIIVHNCADETRYECTMPLPGRGGVMGLSF
jgi:hypothetical protein